jgi:RNA polymerase sigma-70 factor (ECF subfamily)
MDDVDAIQRCRRGETDTFRHLVYRYQRRALAHARTLTGGDADAADMVQSAFLDAFKQLDRFDASREFYAWFYVLLRNRCFKHWGRTRDRAVAAVPAELVARDTGPSEKMLDLRRALDRLEPQDREILVLKHVDGWTYDELAERLDIPRGTVMSRLFHARRRLKQLLGDGAGEKRSGEKP